MAIDDEGGAFRERCYACGHRLALPSETCPRCGEEFDEREDPEHWPEGCRCARCLEARRER
jgi:hypothetical protein